MFDTNSGLRLNREVELKNRLEYTIFSQYIHLSPDETRLYYQTYDPVTEIYGVGIVHMDDPAAPIADVKLPRACFFPTIDVTGAGAMFACRTGGVYLVSPSGTVEYVGGGPGAVRDRRVPLPPVSLELAAAFRRPDGTVIALRMNGEMVLIERGETRALGRAFQEGNEVWVPGLGRQVGEKAIIAYRKPIAQEASGVVLLDLLTGQSRELPNTANSKFATRVGGGTLIQQPAGLRLIDDSGVDRLITGLFGDDQAGWTIAW
ncbi:MAG: hypothetical protein C0506_13085 [Anaerolinea sp.]|nr:hypothetical protein [Anaerolinea sp.]